jgi:5-methylcytosine-specific restriction protein A
VDKPFKPCPELWCPNLVQSNHGSARCPEHTTRSPYDHQWAELASAYLRTHPRCQRCHSAPAREVDHIIPLKLGGARLDPHNLRGLCVSCHRSVTPREYQKRRSRERVHR